ncbi:TetR/AcrR family transcriptional regulator [Acidovorax sp.]|uniref:TetR/AcrR family transcriptional regulator n=1 Tax=Acidovorax sp. TaxID=1872122 RepID=UPI002637E243|nr:TetR/AcrR family transcriptional regulator [Acidovorax sp.]
MDSLVPRTSAIAPSQKKPSARTRSKAVVPPGANPVSTAEPSVEEATRRPRGRPRKTAEELDDGNRRRELMDTAARLFLTQGFAATSTRDIAAAVGMHSGSPFYHFESKSALLFAVMNEGMTTAAQSQQQALDALAASNPKATARERLRVLIRHHFEVLLGPRSGFIPVMLYEWRSLTLAQRKSIARVKDAYEIAWMPTLEALARKKVLQADPGVARLFIFGALNWAVQWFTPKKGKSLDELTEEALALFIHEV